MLFSSTNFGEQYFLFDDYYIPLYRYVKEKFSVCSYVPPFGSGLRFKCQELLAGQHPDGQLAAPQRYMDILAHGAETLDRKSTRLNSSH